ncbi:MAG: flagellar hook-basal body complex protein [Bacillota bacterium]|nr:flagellar hook-basal body complex protein [Bacillota bacterium]
MLRSLYSGISGMKVNQTKLDTIGNNIANVGTTSFKSGRVRFSDMLSQNVSGAMAPGNTQGGINPKQVGLGVSVAGIDTLVSQGMMQPTNRSLDFAVDGEGYFMVGKGQLPEDNTNGILLNQDNTVNNTNGMSVYYTRDGAFSRDDNGSLVTSDGYRVLGYSLTGSNGLSSIDYENGYLKQVNMINADDEALKAENTLVPMVIPDKIKYPAVPAELIGSMQPKTIMAEGELSINIDNDPAKTITINVSSLDNLDSIISKINTAFGSDIASDEGGMLKITSDTNGASSSAKIDSTSNPEVVAALGLSGASASGSDAKDIRITSFSVEKDGLIKAVLDDGTVAAIGQIAVSSFNNPDGLTKLGKNIYQNSANSGDAVLRTGVGSAQDNGKGYGDVLQYNLEMSNVDLAEQFTDMIVASRAFQANSKVITTGDEILQDILSIKR